MFSNPAALDRLGVILGLEELCAYDLVIKPRFSFILLLEIVQHLLFLVKLNFVLELLDHFVEIKFVLVDLLAQLTQLAGVLHLSLVAV